MINPQRNGTQKSGEARVFNECSCVGAVECVKGELYRGGEGGHKEWAGGGTLWRSDKWAVYWKVETADIRWVCVAGRFGR